MDNITERRDVYDVDDNTGGVDQEKCNDYDVDEDTGGVHDIR